MTLQTDAVLSGTVTVGTIAAGDNNIGNVDVVTLPALPAGTNNIGDVDVLSIAAGDNDIGNVDIVTLPALPTGTNTIGNVGVVPLTSGGLSIFKSIDLDETEEEVKATAGQVYSVWFTNTATTTRWLKFYNDTAANVTVGTTVPVITIGLPGNTSDDISGSFNLSGNGLAFSTAITVAATNLVADNDATAPSANDVIVMIGFK